MYEILTTLVTLVAPVLTFSAEEVWQYMPKDSDMAESVQLAQWPAAHPEYLDAALEAKWEQILTLRGEITKALETARRNKVIGHSLDATVQVYAGPSEFALLDSIQQDLATILIVSKASIHEKTQNAPVDAYRSPELDLAVAVAPATGEKCERCWIYCDTVGTVSEHEQLCERCASVVKKL
ncbi:Isoleucine--tRNA ligase [bioreactor metagenome]|uniref:Isoleucine--tRNA ligase n=1 Tax=bioreactor metagenome TaxID=1076179 RepID=A0A645CI99_9ZZZZ